MAGRDLQVSLLRIIIDYPGSLCEYIRGGAPWRNAQKNSTGTATHTIILTAILLNPAHHEPVDVDHRPS